jgi:hypothetical protein
MNFFLPSKETREELGFHVLLLEKLDGGRLLVGGLPSLIRDTKGRDSSARGKKILVGLGWCGERNAVAD